MKFFRSFIFLVLALSMNISRATEYTCSNITENVALLIAFTGLGAANIEVKSPAQRHLVCSVNDFKNGQDTIKAFICGNDNDLPELIVIHESSMKGFMELKDQPHYDLDCK